VPGLKVVIRSDQLARLCDCEPKENIMWTDSFNRPGGHILLGVLVGTLGLIMAAAGYPIGERAMVMGYTWAARSMWGSPQQDNLSIKPTAHGAPTSNAGSSHTGAGV
jgi:hypothetical protein